MRRTAMQVARGLVGAAPGPMPMATVVLPPAIDDGTEDQPSLLASGALAQVLVVVADRHGIQGLRRVEMWAEPAGHGARADKDLLTVLVSDVPPDAPGASVWRRFGHRDRAEIAETIVPCDIGGASYVLPAGPGRLLRHETPTGRTECTYGCGAEHEAGVASAGEDCPDCGEPLASVLAPDGRTFCPRPCGVGLYEGQDHPPGSECPACRALADRGEEPQDPYAGVGGQEGGIDPDDGPCPWCGEEGGVGDEAAEVLAGLAGLAGRKWGAKDLRALRDLAERAADLVGQDDETEADG